ncbi:hybrid-cluster NAD(P)-dependent oxidoreductase [Salinicola endophyticus]|uniref:hybrid-cluster NAD(P)-dependent oxidoreductase n=1 Tax=Salinicola endophyticus TaxID=1949083 RepID=UPI000DA122D9|nr:hybrid-cluster NAD(P)-dependent oxidoreductase [Salinicola endophyticus]
MTALASGTPPTFWHDSETLECVSVLPETPNVATFCFQAPSGGLFRYLPGQFLTLALPTAEGVVHRTYTISSSPSRPMSLTITVKAQRGSVGTRWMLDHLQPGMRVKAIGPAGRFSLGDAPARKYLFISAGSGITPMMSMTTYLYDQGRDPDIVFVNCARRPSEIIFRERLEHIASRVTGIELRWVVEQTDRYAPWTGYQGFFNQLMLGLMAPDYLEREVFCCGPEPFMQAVRDALVGLGFDLDNHYHQESFDAPLPETSDVPDSVVLDEESRAEIAFSRSAVTHRCSETDTLLGAAKAAGVSIPSGCTFGVCGSCKVKKLAGDVHMVHNGGITDADIEAGYVLACCSHPRGAVVIDA